MVEQVEPLSVDEVEEVELLLVEQDFQLLDVVVHEIQLLDVVVHEVHGVQLRDVVGHGVHGWWRLSPL